MRHRIQENTGLAVRPGTKTKEESIRDDVYENLRSGQDVKPPSLPPSEIAHQIRSNNSENVRNYGIADGLRKTAILRNMRRILGVFPDCEIPARLLEKNW